MPDQILTLVQLQTLIRQGIEQKHPSPYWITAEISELKVNYSGHCYLELVEKGGENHVPKAKASGVIWRTAFRMIEPYFRGATGQPLAAGLSVLIKVSVAYHELYGLSLQIFDIDPNYTLGDMERQRRETIRRLEQEGVYAMNHELPLPLVIQRLAVISSRNAAGYQDFIRELGNSAYAFSVTLFDAFMQGAGAEESIVEALDRVADHLDDFDALVLIRGGGSQSDLGAFDSYRLCCHLAQFPLPVITGIGHDKDQSVADLVAAVTLKTPTAVAVFLKEEIGAFDAQLDEYFEELSSESLALLDARRQRILNAAFALRLVSGEMIHGMQVHLGELRAGLAHATEGVVRRGEHRLHLLRTSFGQALSHALMTERTRIARFAPRLADESHSYLKKCARDLKWMADMTEGHAPERVLRRGFALVRSGNGVVTGVASLRSGDGIEVVMHDGRMEADVTAVETNMNVKK